MQRHTFTTFNTTFIVDSESKSFKELRQGTYGSVIAVKHKCMGKKCAIKKILDINTKVSGCCVLYLLTHHQSWALLGCKPKCHHCCVIADDVFVSSYFFRGP